MKVLCEICGNDFNRKPIKNYEGELGVVCPYCNSFNKVTFNKKKVKYNDNRNRY